MGIRGLAFPFTKSALGLPAPAVDDDVIADNITRILETPRGSRVMRPDAGSDTYSFVFDSTGPLLQARIDNEVRRAVAVGEPRARILQVVTSERETSDGIEILVEVVFEALGVVRTTTATFTP